MQSESEFIPNGVVSSKAPFIAKVLDKNRWSKAEARAAEMLAHVQPNPTSEACRNAVLSYLRCLIMTCVPCQVFTFGSVPLKTYLPDGDIDLTVFADNQYPEERLIKDVLYILQSEEKNKRGEFHVKEVQFIHAEVKIIKCLVEKFVVDISFSQIGGLGTLCFLEEIDFLIKQDHLFKLSVILIKAWCYYESRILGSHYGLISTYALETLVIYVFHVHSNTFAGPLEVLFRFLDFFNKFDWNNYCISLRGPVPITSLPNMRAEPPRQNCQQLLLSEKFLNACESCYGIIPTSQELKEKPFVSKYINIVDPLRPNNNLGRSITKGNFCRFKSAIALGAKRIERLLNCPEDNIIAEVDLFFRNTWERNGNGYWIDARTYSFYRRNNYVTNHESAETSHRFHGTHTNTMKNALANRSMHHYQNNHQSLGLNSCDWIDEYAFDPNNASSDYYFEYGSGVNDENAFPVNEAMLMHGEEYHASIFNEYQKASTNMDSCAVSFPQPPHVLAPGYMHANSFGVFRENVPSFESFSGHNLPYSYGTGPFHAEWFPSLRSAFNEAELAEPVDHNIGSSSGNSSRKSGATSHTPKDYVVTADQKGLNREKHSGNPLDNRIRNKNVNSRASSSSGTTLPPTSKTNLCSSSFTTGSSSKTNQPYATSAEAITSHVQAGKLPMTVPNSSLPGSSQRAVDNQSLLPVSDDSSGSSFQDPTMFQSYNLPTETGTSFATTNDVNMHAESSVWNSTQHVNQTNHDAAATNILEGDVETYLVNLQYGRFCKNPQPERPLPNNHPTNRLPLRRQFPWFRKPLPAGVMNSMGYVHTPLPVMPSQHALPLHGGTNQSAAFWLPRFSDGTGTYMPNPSSYDQQRYYTRKRHQKFHYLENQKYDKKQDKIEMPGSNESSHQGESSDSGTSEVANSGSDSKSSSADQPSS